MSKNTALWDSVCTTDPKTTKKVNTRGGFTAIDAQSQLKKATEMFGAFGSGWGVKDETFQQPIQGVIIYQATFYYEYKDTKGEFPLHSAIVLAINNRVDDDAVKKVATDALTIGLSKLGFNSDVFEGKFDDNKYVNQMESEYKPQATQQQKEKIETLLEDSGRIGEDICKQAVEWLKEHPTSDDYNKMISKLEEKRRVAIAEMEADPKD